MMRLYSIKAIVTFVLLMGFSMSQAQTLTPVVIASTGGHGGGSWGSLSYTGGEAVIQTGVSSAVTLTQGFHQPLIIPGVGITTPSLDETFTFYPNPAREYINLVTSLKKGEVRLYNDVGQVLWQSDIIPQQVAIHHYATGIYQVVVVSDKVRISRKLIVF